MAGARCAGPSISHTSGTVDRGETITVTGDGFGDNCYDTGPPPAREGVLGRPLSGIEVVLAQDGNEVVAAQASADRDYHFEVDVVVPSSLQPGPVTVRARSGGTAVGAPPAVDPLVVSDAPVTGVTSPAGDGGAPDSAAAPGSGEAAPAATQPPDASGPGEASPWLLVGLPLAAAGALAALAARALVRRRSGRAEPVAAERAAAERAAGESELRS